MTVQRDISPRAWAELLALALVWGAVFLAVRIALGEIGVLSTVAHRAFWAALVLWALVVAKRLPVPRAARLRHPRARADDPRWPRPALDIQ